MSKSADVSTGNDDSISAGETLNEMAITRALRGYNVPSVVIAQGFYDDMYVIVTDHSINPGKIDTVVKENAPGAVKGADGWTMNGKELVVASCGSRIGGEAYDALKPKKPISA